nr:thioredoxin [Phascolosoma esculenta]
MAAGQVMSNIFTSSGLVTSSHFLQTSTVQHMNLPACILLRHVHTTSPSMNQHMFNIQDTEDFNKSVLKSKTPVIVDFHATWCGPCKLLGPRLESLVTKNDGEVLLAKVDMDDHQDLAMNHNVEAVPTVVGFKDGKVVDSFVGLVDDDKMETFIQKLKG